MSQECARHYLCLMTAKGSNSQSPQRCNLMWLDARTVGTSETRCQCLGMEETEEETGSVSSASQKEPEMRAELCLHYVCTVRLS